MLRHVFCFPVMATYLLLWRRATVASLYHGNVWNGYAVTHKMIHLLFPIYLTPPFSIQMSLILV